MRKQITRRTFLLEGLLATGALGGLAGCSTLFRRSSKPQVWALLSDPHIPGEGTAPKPSSGLFHFDPEANLKRVVQEIGARSDFAGVAVTGDLARLTGQPNDYVRFHEILAPLSERGPVLLAMGNHDRRENFSKTFTDPDGKPQPVEGKRVRVAEGKECLFVVLDSCRGDEKDEGELGEAQKVWLSGFLEKTPDRKPVLLLVHHTPEDLPDLLKIARPARQVKAIVFGHSHVWGCAEQEGLHLVNLPAIGYSFAEKEPVGWIEAALGREEGVFTLHVVGGGRERDGETRRLRWR
ncbi:MAG TPA: metallophosphoesterase [Candidatus Sumerlaeota bacterium]|nr:metallophosphoesterase [Candidatus Sumerlaeota bacterium]